MKVKNIIYSDNFNLEKTIKENNFHKEKNILIQVFTSSTKLNFINKLKKDLLTLIPQGKIIGATTCGGIYEGELENKTIISISQFDKTILKTYITKGQSDSFVTGRQLAKKIPENKQIKAAICFTDSLLTNGEEFLNGFASINPDLIIAGGMASDNLNYSSNYVFNEEKTIEHGAVIVSLENEELEVLTQHSFNWQAIGKPHKVTHAIKNRVYSIDDKNTLEFYKEYLGESIDSLLPEISLEFPLIIKNNKLLKGRAVVEVHEDGSFSYSGNIKEGEIVKFGYANVNLMLDKNNDNICELISSNVEAIFIYSCIARKLFLKENICHEIEPYKKIAPSSGFFTYGEFYKDSKRDKKPKLLNQAITILALSESKKRACLNKIEPHINENLSNEKEVVLNHIISKITNELDDLTLNLKETVKKEVKKNEEKDTIINITQAQAEVGYMLEMIAHQWRQPLSGISSIASIINFKNSLGQLEKNELEELSSEILELSNYANETIEDFRKLFENKQKFEEITIEQLMKKVKNIFKSLLIRKNIIIEKDYICSPNEIIKIPLGQTLQVFINIIKNAIDALIEKDIQNPLIKIYIRKEEKYFIFEIEDNAEGIKEETLFKIFDKRFSTKKEKGTGLGLNICKSIVEKNLKGEIEASNTKKGALFKVSIPC